VGASATSSGIASIAIGASAVVGAFQGAIAIGNVATPTAAQQAHIGSASAVGEITDFNVVNNSAGGVGVGFSNRTLRAQINFAAVADTTGLWIPVRNSNNAADFKQVTLAAVAGGQSALRVANP
jgi:hypothetical protein